jgi:5-formyltetrahydrofolate cyclo-ligase
MTKEQLRILLLNRPAIEITDSIRITVYEKIIMLLKGTGQNVKCIAMFQSLKSEPPTDYAIDQLLKQGYQVIVPKSWTEIEFKDIKTNEPVPLKQAGIVFVPAVALAQKSATKPSPSTEQLSFTRLGRGGGWYDRILPTIAPGTKKIGLIWKQDLFYSIPTESHDVKLDEVITI